MAVSTAADRLLNGIKQTELVDADKGYDSDAVREKIEAKSAAANIPPKRNRIWKNRFSPMLYRDRNVIERIFGKLKDFLRVATRYNKLAETFHATVCIAAIVSSW